MSQNCLLKEKRKYLGKHDYLNFKGSDNRENTCEVTYRKYALKQGVRIGVIKYDIQGVFLKCAEMLLTSLFDNIED
jgi:hypothetical protein